MMGHRHLRAERGGLRLTGSAWAYPTFSQLDVRLWLTIFAVGLAIALLGSTARASAAACNRVQVPNVGSGDNQLLGVAVISSRDVWAVGYFTKSRTSRSAGLIEHWDGRSWKIQRTAKRGYSQLSGVAATSSTNAWAVGADRSGALIEHWNGRSWKMQRAGTQGSSRLVAVTATSSTNAWAVGADGSGALIEHWNGRAWKVQPSPLPPNSELLGVTATSSRNAWAVGNDPSGVHPLIAHWNGRRWTVQVLTVLVPPPVGGGVLGRDAELSGVAATSPSNAWAVGYADTYGHGSGEQTSEMIIEHWNGHAWKRQASADPGVDTSDPPSHLFGVSAISSHDAWAVGGGSLNGATIQHRQGGAWIDQAAPGGELFSVASASSTNVWAVGTYLNNAGTAYRTLAVRCH